MKLKFRQSLTCLFTLLLLSLPTTADTDTQSEDEGWEPRLEKNGIQVLARKPAGEQHQAFKATTLIEASVPSIIALLQDNAACTRWLFRCKESYVVEAVSNQERFFYQATKLPFPVKSRDAVFHALVSYREDGSVLVSLNAVAGKLPETSAVRMNNAYGYYLVEPLADGQTRVTWQQFVDPGGALPAWLVNSMLTDLPYNSLEAFREMVKTPPYSEARFGYNDEGVPIELVLPQGS